LPLKALQLKTTQTHSPLTAKFGGGQLKLAATARLSTKRAGFGLAARVAAIRLSPKVAVRLDKKLRLRGVFAGGQLLGSSLTDAQPEAVAIKPAGAASLELSPEFQAKLASLFVAVNPIFPAEHLGHAFMLPIATGKLAPNGLLGTLRTVGALEAIQQGGGQAFLREFWPDLGAHTAGVELELDPAPPHPGELGRVSIADLGAGAVASDPKARTITVTGSPMTLQPTTAQELNETFAMPQGRSDVFRAGDLLGTISFSASAE
jgi:hypothetical protein